MSYHREGAGGGTATSPSPRPPRLSWCRWGRSSPSAGSSPWRRTSARVTRTRWSSSTWSSCS